MASLTGKQVLAGADVPKFRSHSHQCRGSHQVVSGTRQKVTC